MKRIHDHSFFLMLAVSITVLVAVIYAYMYYEIGASVSRAVEARAILNADTASRAHEQDFMSLYRSTEPQWARLPDFFIPSDNVVSFIESIESLSKQTGTTVSLASISADNLDAAPPGSHGAVHARITASGSWSSVMKVLSLSQVMPYKVSINNVSLASSGASSPTKGGPATPGWNLSFDLTAAMIVPAASSTPH